MTATTVATSAPVLDAALEARTRLSGLLGLAATIELGDLAAWDALAGEARLVVRSLAAAGLIPAHLGVREGEPAVVTQRTLAAARRHLGR
jgi:hypothetical protein